MGWGVSWLSPQGGSTSDPGPLTTFTPTCVLLGVSPWGRTSRAALLGAPLLSNVSAPSCPTAASSVPASKRRQGAIPYKLSSLAPGLLTWSHFCFNLFHFLQLLADERLCYLLLSISHVWPLLKGGFSNQPTHHSLFILSSQRSRKLQRHT